MAVHVYIATTDGLVAIEQITHEPDALTRSVICYQGEARELPISSAYNQFVDRSTGLVAKLFGEGMYCIDLDGWIESGDSWQLPVLLAHSCYANKQLASQPLQAGDQIIVATGKVNCRSQAVEPVAEEGIAPKLAAMAQQVEGWRQAGAEVTLIVPDAHGGQVTEAELTHAGLVVSQIRVLAVSSFIQAQQALKCTNEKQTLPAKIKPSNIIKIRWLPILSKNNIKSVVGSCLLLLVVLAMYSGYNQYQAANADFKHKDPLKSVIKTPASPVVVEQSKGSANDSFVKPGGAVLIVERARYGIDCEHGTVVQEIDYSGQKTMPAVLLAGLCRVALRLGSTNQWQAAAIIKGSKTAIPLTEHNGEWELTLPKHHRYDKHYLWVLSEKQGQAKPVIIEHTLLAF